MDLKNKLNEIFDLYLDATGKNPTDGSIRLGYESDSACVNAASYLKEDPTGFLSAMSIRNAYRKVIEERSFTVEELLDGTWDEVKPKFEKLTKAIYESEVGQLCDNFFNLIVKHCKVIGKDFSKKYIESFINIEDIIVKAIDRFNSKNYFQHEKFSEGETKINKNVKILPRLYNFQYLKSFVDQMKQSKEDNFICIALIDRTYEKIENDYYDNHFDSFFAFGFKNNGVVFTVSDRVTWDSPEGAFKTRNPGRNFRDKIDFSWMPYVNLDKIKSSLQNINQLLLPFNDSIDNTQGNNIIDLFTDSNIIYSVLIMTLIYDRYFCKEIENKCRKYFSDEIKLISHSSRALALKDELRLPILPNDIKANSYQFDDNIYSNSLYEYLIDMYPLKVQTPVLNNFIGDEETAQKYIWWNVRKQQAEYIEECLKNGYWEKEHKIINWEANQVIKNLKSIIEFMIDNPDKDCFTTNYKTYFAKQDDPRPLFWKEYRDKENVETYKLTTSLNDDIFNHSGYQKIIQTKYGDIKYSCYGNRNYITFIDDNASRKGEIELILRSHSDLQRFFNLKNEELPKEIRKHFYAVSGYCSKLAWEPYTGNSILDFTDPMNDIRNPFDNIGCVITIYLSKSKLKQFKRKLNKGE